MTLYFLADSLVQRTMVETMKMVANAAREAMAMRHCFTTPRVEQVLASALFEASRDTVVVAGVDLDVGIGNLLGTRGLRIAPGLVELEAAVVLVELVWEVVVVGSVVELNPAVPVNSDVKMWVLVAETG